MWNSRETTKRREVVDGTIAVAVDKEKSSQYALKWAIEHLVSAEQIVKLVHVKERPFSPGQNGDPSAEQGMDDETKELFLPFRVFCRRRQVQCETIVLEDTDVARALIEYVGQAGVESMLLGAPARNGFSRLFKTSDIPGNVIKWAPDFCTVYVISKGKISSVRNASRPLPTVPPGARINVRAESLVMVPRHEEFFDELSTYDNDIPVASSGRPSTDSNFMDFYENLGGGVAEESSSYFNFDRTGQSSPDPTRYSIGEREDDGFLSSFRPSRELSPVNDFHKLDRRTSLSLHIMDAHDEEMRRLKTELKQTIDMYHAACKEALTAKQKATELEQWKLESEKRLEEALIAERNSLEMVEHEKAKCKDAIEAAELAQKLLEMEIQKTANADIRALLELETQQKNQVVNSLDQPHLALEYRSLYHMILVLFLLHVYFSISLF